MALINLPKFYEDPLYRPTQDRLSSFSAGLMEGKVPDYYKDIGEAGGAPFEDVLRMTTRDISRGVGESLAKSRTSRGGLGASVIADKVGDATTKLRWADMLRALEGKQFLLGLGTRTQEGVRSSALQFGGQKNQFNLNTATMELNMAQAEQARADQKKAQKSAMWSQILSGAIGAGSNLLGMGMYSKAIGAGASLLGGGGGGGGISQIKDFQTPSYFG